MRKWLPKNNQKPRAIVFIVHGVGEHSGRYDHVARMMVKKGFAVFSLDHQGHGLSDGPRVYAEDLNHLAQDYLEYARHILKISSSDETNNNPSFETAHDLTILPRFLFGHSMGGVLSSMIHDLDDQIKWNGVILSAGAFFCHPMAKFQWFRSATAFLAHFIPRFPTDEFNLTYLSRDVHWVTRIQRDPAGAPHGVTLKLGYQIVMNGLAAIKRAPTWKTPVYIYHGEKDAVTLSIGSQKFHRVCGSEDKTLKIIPTDIHELHNDQGYEQVVQDVIEWIEKHLPTTVTTNTTKKTKS
jgi:acylglycerol lipase